MKEKFGDPILNYKVFDDVDLSTFKRLLLRTSGNDFLGTYFRDALLQDLLSPLDMELQASRPSVVYINGEYWGIHNIREKLDKHYLMTHFNLKEDEFDLLEVCGTLSHGTGSEYRDLIEFVKHKDLNIPKNYQHITDKIDIENYINQHLAEIYFGNTDWPGNNVKIWKKRGSDGKWRWMTFDLDLSFGYNKIRKNILADYNSFEDAIAEDSEKWYNYECSTLFLRTFLKVPAFRSHFIRRYLELSKTIFSPDHIIKNIDEYEQLYKTEMVQHINRWNYPRSMKEWHMEIEKMREYARNRPDHFRKHIESHFGATLEELSN